MNEYPRQPGSPPVEEQAPRAFEKPVALNHGRDRCCPFCASRDAFRDTSDNVPGKIMHRIRCLDCRIRTAWFDTAEQAIAAWHRAPESGNREAREPSGTLSTGAKAAQINAAPEVGAPTGAVEKLPRYQISMESGMVRCSFGQYVRLDHVLAALRTVEDHVTKTYGQWEPDRMRAQVARLGAIIADADSAASCMFYRGPKSWGEHETQQLLAALRSEAPELLTSLAAALQSLPAPLGTPGEERG